MAPSRPAVFPEQVGLLMVSLFVIAASLVFLFVLVGP